MSTRMSLSLDGDIKARAIEFALMKVIKVKYGTWSMGKLTGQWAVILLFGVIPLCAEASVGKVA